jgi:hypothetical protein
LVAELLEFQGPWPPVLCPEDLDFDETAIVGDGFLFLFLALHEEETPPLNPNLVLPSLAGFPQ